MKAFAVRFCAVIGVAVTAMALLGTGTSAAKDSYQGMTYADAAAKVEGRGGKAVISTVVGSQVPFDECIVESSHRPTYAKRDGFDHAKETLFSLNCTAKLAHSGLPGNSLASPEGREQQVIENKASRLNAKPEACEQNLESCQKFCEKYSLCSKELMALF